MNECSFITEDPESRQGKNGRRDRRPFAADRCRRIPIPLAGAGGTGGCGHAAGFLPTGGEGGFVVEQSPTRDQALFNEDGDL
jgi:hypothetical protein